jgi:hypothetical protein
MAEVLETVKQVLNPKTPGTDQVYEVSFEEPIYRAGARDYRIDDCFRLEDDNGWEYVCIHAGHTALRPPRFPQSDGEEFIDGSARFRTRPASSNSLARHLSGAPVWSAAGITFSRQVEFGELSQAVASGGEHGRDYDVLVVATFTDDTHAECYAVIPVRIPVTDVSELG